MVGNSNRAINSGGNVNVSLLNFKVIESDGNMHHTSVTSSSPQIPNGTPAYPCGDIKDSESTEMVSSLCNRDVAISGNINNQTDSVFLDNETGNTNGNDHSYPLGNTLGAKASSQEESTSISSDKDCLSTISDVNALNNKVDTSDHPSRDNGHSLILYDKDATNKEPNTPPDKVTTYSAQNDTAKELTPNHISKEVHDNLGYLPDSANGKHIPGGHKKQKDTENDSEEEREPTPGEIIEDSNRHKKASLTTGTSKSTKETITHVEIDTEDFFKDYKYDFSKITTTTTIQLPDTRSNIRTNQGMVGNSNRAINSGGNVNVSLLNFKVIESDGNMHHTSVTSSSPQIPNGTPAYPCGDIKDSESTEMVSSLCNRDVAISGNINNQTDSVFLDNETGNTNGNDHSYPLGNTLGAKASSQEESTSISSDKDCLSTISDVNALNNKVDTSDHPSRDSGHSLILYDKDATNKEPNTPPDKVTTYSAQNDTAKELTPNHISKEVHDNLGYLPDSANGKHIPGGHKKQKDKENGREEEREPTPGEIIEDSNRHKKASLTTGTSKSTKETITHVEIDTEDSGLQIGKTLKIVLSISNCFMITIVIGLLYALSVLLIGIIDEFQASRSQASPIFSVFTAILFGGGGVVGPLMNRFNGGALCMIGAILASGGFVISFFAQSVLIIVLSVGVMAGFGLTVPFLLPFTSAGGNMYGKHRLTMITVTSICPGIGGVIFPVMTSKLVDIYGWRGVILIYGGLLLNCLPVGYLNYIVKRRFCNTLEQKANLKEIFNCSLFRKPLYLVLVFCVFLMNTLLPTVNVFFVDMVRGKGFDVETGSFLLSINGFSNVAGRIVITFLTPFLKCARVGQWSLYLSIVSATVSVFVVASTYSELMVTTIVYGLFWGMAIVSYPAMLLELSGPKRYTNAIGYCNLIGGIGGLIGGPIAGLIKDVTGNYDAVFFGTTGLGLTGSAMLGAMYVREVCKKSREKSGDNPEKSVF